MSLRALALVLGSVGGAVITLFYPYFGLLTLALLTFGRPQDGRPNMEAMHIPMILSITLIVATILRLGTMGTYVWAAIKRMWLMLLFYGLVCASTLANLTPLSSNRCYELCVVMCLCLLTLTWTINEQRLRRYIVLLLVCGGYNAYYILRHPSHILETISGQKYTRFYVRGATGFGNSNYMALLMVVTICLAICMLPVFRSLLRRLALIALIGSAGYVFFQANSRGASIALAADLVCYWLIQRHKIRGVLTLALLGGAALAFAPQSYWARLHTVSTYQEDASAMQRLELWDIALKLIPEHPVLGVGPDNFTLYADNTPHDAFLQIGSEVGIPALLAYIGILILGLYSAARARYLTSPLRNSRPDLYAISLGLFLSVVTVTVQGFTTGLAHREFVYGYVTLCCCARALAEKAAMQKSEVEAVHQTHAPEWHLELLAKA